MATNLDTLVETLKRAVSTPGRFEADFPDATDEDLAALLMDGFAEAQLDRWFNAHTMTETGAVSPDLSRGEGALVVIYAAHRMLSSALRNIKTGVRYQAGSVEYETQQSAQLLRVIYEDLAKRKADLIAAAGSADVASGFFMADLYLTRLNASASDIDLAIAR